MILSIREFIGHFHPVLVHLPIGILIIGLLLQWMSVNEKYKFFKVALPFIYGAGFITAFFSCISGYLLSLNNESDFGTVSLHMWMGLLTTAISAALFYLVLKKRFDTTTRYISFLLFALILFTGHLGGSLTHGPGYLSLSVLKGEDGETFKRQPVPDVQQALLYEDLVQPVLHEKCFSCHNQNKSKGGLRMDDKNAFLKGGKNGVVLNTANAEKGELWKRIILPESDDDHMPPKGKPQLTENEMALLHWWMKNGSPFDKRVNEFSQEGKDKEMLVSFEGETDRPLYNTDIPEEPVAAADDRLLKALRASGIVVLPVAQNSNYLEVVFPYGNKVRTGTMDSILMIRDQLVSFKAGGTILPEEDVQKLKACKSLIKLEMQYTGISDAGLQFIKELRALRYLNLSGTPVTESGISALKELRNIKKIYLYQTKVNRSNWKELQQAFPEAQLDSGGYIVPLFTSDTTVVQKPPEKD